MKPRFLDIFRTWRKEHKTPVFGIFKIKREERLPAVVALLVFVILNALLIYKYYGLFTRGGKVGFWSLFWDHFRVSGFDSYTYITLSNWDVYYEVYRHPLLAILMYPFYTVNHWILVQTEYNNAIFIVAAILVFCAFYSFVFFYRILHEVIGLGRMDATLLSSMFFSFAYIMLTVMVPDHFCLSLFLLTMALYISGTKMNKGRKMKTWQTFVLFFFTAGVTLSNGVKIWLAQWFANGRDFFRLRNILIGVVAPALLLMAISIYQDNTYVKPMLERGEQVQLAKEKKDSLFAKKSHARLEAFKKKTGEKIGDKGFLKWTDVSTSRCKSIVENLFGESIQLHERYLLRDIHYGRPVFVTYSHWYNYLVEALLVILFLWGVYLGRQHRFLWLCLSWLVIDMSIHVLLGFGLNEVYIMTAHWAFVLPISMSYVLKFWQGWRLISLRLLYLLITLYLFIYNGSLIVEYMTKTITK